MPVGDFTSSGFGSCQSPAMNGGVFSLTGTGLSGCKRSLNGRHEAGNFEVFNMAPEQKRQRILPEEATGILPSQTQKLDYVANGCLPPVYGHYGCLPNFKQPERTESLSLDAPLSSAAVSEDLSSVAGKAAVVEEVEMEACESTTPESSELSSTRRDVHMRMQDTMYGTSQPVCVFEHRTNCHARGCREFLWEDMYLGYHGL